VILLFLCQICSFIIENSSGAKSSPKRRRLTSIKYKKKRPGLRRVWPGGPGPGSTLRVDRVSPGQLPSGFLPPPGPVPCPGRPDPGSSRQAGPGFKTLYVATGKQATRKDYNFLFFCLCILSFSFIHSSIAIKFYWLYGIWLFARN
jgi:hypothetical protein